MEIIKPIFIIGPARSGTTILGKLFTRHKDTGYFEHYMGKYFDSRWKLRLLPLMHQYRKLRYGITRPIPSNGGFFYTPFEYVDDSGITTEIKNYYFSAIKTSLKLFKASRFVNKGVGHCSRIRWLKKLFPDAYYVIIRRDPKPIISSMKRMMENTKKWQVVKERFGKDVSDIETCINMYSFYIQHLTNDLPLIKERAIEVHYEDLVTNTRDELKRLYEFTELYWYDEIKKDIPEHLELHNNEKWKTLPEDDRILLEKKFP